MNTQILFGPALREARLALEIPLWKFATAIPHHQGNIQRIERGIREPRIDLAMRCLLALKKLKGLEIGTFMSSLAIKAGLRSTHGETVEKKLHSGKLRLQAPNSDQNLPPFAVLLRETRVAHALSQKALASAAGYSIRNLISVENGRQNPLVSTALSLASATGCDLACFFNELAKRVSEEQQDSAAPPDCSGG